MYKNTAPGDRDARSATAIVDTVLDALSAGRLPPGARLGEDSLSTHVAVSRTIIRDALRELAFLGVVELLPRRGASVIQPTPRDADELYYARIALETALVADLARHCTAADIRALRDHLKIQHAARRRGDRAFGQALGDFHLVVARMAGNAVMLNLLMQLVARTSLLSALYGSADMGCALDHHEDLIAALAAGKPARAATLMRRHLRENRARLQFPAVPPPPAGKLDLAAALAAVRQNGAPLPTDAPQHPAPRRGSTPRPRGSAARTG